MKWTFQLSLAALMRRDPRVMLIYGDVGGVMFSDIRRDFGSRVINYGIAEQSMVSCAAGLALAGFRPVVYTITPFLIERAFEQIKLDVAQMRLPVGLVGYSEPGHGPTHSEIDAPALMRLLPDIRSHFPVTKDGLLSAMEQLDLEHPWFIALRKL